MYTPSDKTNPHFIPPCAAELYEVFDRLENAARKGGIFRHHGGVTPFCARRAQKKRIQRMRNSFPNSPECRFLQQRCNCASGGSSSQAPYSQLAASGKARPFHCSSSPNSERCAGLLLGPISVLPVFRYTLWNYERLLCRKIRRMIGNGSGKAVFAEQLHFAGLRQDLAVGAMLRRSGHNEAAASSKKRVRKFL